MRMCTCMYVCVYACVCICSCLGREAHWFCDGNATPLVTCLIQLRHDSFTCDMTHRRRIRANFYAWNMLYSVARISWLIHTWHHWFTRGMTLVSTHSYMTWLIPMWRDSLLTHQSAFHAPHDLYMTHVSHMTWLIHTRHDSFICDMRGITHFYVWHDSIILVTWLIHM